MACIGFRAPAAHFYCGICDPESAGLSVVRYDLQLIHLISKLSLLFFIISLSLDTE